MSSSAIRRFSAQAGSGMNSAATIANRSNALTAIACQAQPIFVATGSQRRRDAIEEKHCERAGLLATQAIRGGVNREVLNRIKKTGDIFFAESDRDWILAGANVHVSMVGFDDGTENARA